MNSDSEGSRCPSGDNRNPGSESGGRDWRRLFERLMDGRDDAFVQSRDNARVLRTFRRRRVGVFLLLSRELSRQIGNRRRAMAAGGRTDLGTIAQFEVTARWYLFQLIVFGGFALAFPKHTPGPVHSRQRWLAAGMRLAAALNL